jgi:cell division protein FtsB
VADGSGRDVSKGARPRSALGAVPGPRRRAASADDATSGAPPAKQHPAKETSAKRRLPAKRSAAGAGRTRFTGRAGILALALCAVMVTVAYPLQQYLAQRSQLDALEQQNTTTARQVAALQSEFAKWSDPAFVAIQARTRLHYLRPGEIGYVVPNPAAGSEPLGIPTPSTQPWYERLWSTVKSPSASASPPATPTRTLTPTLTPTR